MTGWWDLFGIVESELHFWQKVGFGLLIHFGLLLFVVLPAMSIGEFFERKWTADLQARVGPKRVGLFGYLQWWADGIKLLAKSSRQNRVRSSRIPLFLSYVFLMAGLSGLPFGSQVLMIDGDLSALVSLVAIIAYCFLNVLVGINRPGVIGLLSGLRKAALTLTAIFPLFVVVLSVGIQSGGLSWSEIVTGQSANGFSWNVWSPFGFIGFFTFLGAGSILVGAAPFASADSQMDIRGGVSAGLDGAEFGLVRFSRFFSRWMLAQLAVGFFLGGWALPFSAQPKFLMVIGELMMMITKTFVVMIFVGLLGSLNPVLRMTQTTALVWKVFSPLALLTLGGSVLLRWMENAL